MNVALLIIYLLIVHFAGGIDLKRAIKLTN
jgi:hypothetical protein